jgi:hypothetical protein
MDCWIGFLKNRKGKLSGRLALGKNRVVDSAAEIKIHKFLGFARLELG